MLHKRNHKTTESGIISLAYEEGYFAREYMPDESTMSIEATLAELIELARGPKHQEEDEDIEVNKGHA